MQRYLDKHAFHKEPLIKESPATDLGIVVVIPSLAEDHLITTLNDLAHCDAAGSSSAFFDRRSNAKAVSVEVIVVINHSEDCNDEIRKINETTFYKSVEWSVLHSVPKRRFHILYQPDLPRKKAGVGLARKIGMDEAVRRFNSVNNPEGIILSLDADCRIEKNYLLEVRNFFEDYSKIEGCSINFQHHLEGLSDVHKQAITDYELHLRYFIGIQRWSGFPYAYQTVGSAMAVRAGVYCKVGGMNTRQAGEDFYFLHKVIERGAFAKLNATSVFPSPRGSDRVPFGTGRSMMNQLNEGEKMVTYHPQIFHDLCEFLKIVPLFQDTSRQNVQFIFTHLIPTPVKTFLQSVDFQKKLEEIKEHTASTSAFRKRFFRWFNAFLLMKYVHFARDNFYASVSPAEASVELIQLLGLELSKDASNENILRMLREYDQKRSV